jgi:hypothetical protein
MRTRTRFDTTSTRVRNEGIEMTNIERATKINASHANCAHENSKNARAKCRRAMRAMTNYDAMRVDVNVTQIDACALIANARANVDENQMTIDEIDANEIRIDNEDRERAMRA